MTPEALQAIAIILGPAGAAWLGVKISVNGMRADVREIKADVKEVRGVQVEHGERLATLEAPRRAS